MECDIHRSNLISKLVLALDETMFMFIQIFSNILWKYLLTYFFLKHPRTLLPWGVPKTVVPKPQIFNVKHVRYQSRSFKFTKLGSPVTLNCGLYNTFRKKYFSSHLDDCFESSIICLVFSLTFELIDVLQKAFRTNISNFESLKHWSAYKSSSSQLSQYLQNIWNVTDQSIFQE